MSKATLLNRIDVVVMLGRSQGAEAEDLAKFAALRKEVAALGDNVTKEEFEAAVERVDEQFAN